MSLQKAEFQAGSSYECSSKNRLMGTMLWAQYQARFRGRLDTVGEAVQHPASQGLNPRCLSVPVTSCWTLLHRKVLENVIFQDPNN